MSDTPTENPEQVDTKKLFGNVKPGFIFVRDIDGIDWETKTIERHPDFKNPKSVLRKSVLKTLESALSPRAIDPISVYLGDGGVFHALDGDHRIVNALKKLDGPDDLENPWARIKIDKFVGTRREAQIHAATSNIGESRGNLEDPEMIGVVDSCQSWGMTKEEIVAKIGRGSKRLVSRITKILEASPEVLEAARKGEIDLITGEALSKKPLEEQGEALNEVKTKLEETGGNQRAARTQSGVGIQKRKLLKLGQVESLLFYHWDNFWAMMDGTMARDTWTIAFCGALLRTLGFVPKDGERQPTDDEPMDNGAILTELTPYYDIWKNAQDNPAPTGKGRGRRKKED